MKLTSKLFSVLAVVVLVGTGCSSAENNATNTDAPAAQEQAQTTISVAASFYPLAYLAEEIGGKNVVVTNLTPVGVDAHDFEPTAKDIASVNASDVFLFYGAGMDPWAERVAEDAEAEGAIVLEMTDNIELLAVTDEDEDAHEEEEKEDAHDHEDEDEHAHEEEGHDHEDEHEDEAHSEEEHADEHDHDHDEEDEHEHEDEHAHDHGDEDPHAWLDPVSMREQAELVLATLQEADPENAAAYEERAETLYTNLAALDDVFEESLAQCAQDTVIVSHDAFGYLANRYEFETIAIAGISPSEEPSAKQLAEITDAVEDNGISYVFTETLVSQKLAETVATETGAELLTLHPLEGLTSEEATAGENYISLMEVNAENLQTALECK